jgi:cbb3-type cytochrome oxidase subunit 3
MAFCRRVRVLALLSYCVLLWFFRPLKEMGSSLIR